MSRFRWQIADAPQQCGRPVVRYPEVIKANNQKLWAWLTWETLGNPNPDFQKGDVAMEFGLWRADYVKLCRAGEQDLDKWRKKFSPHDGKGPLGRGWVRIHVLKGFDYRAHAGLIRTFLPFMSIDCRGRLVDPTDAEVPEGQYFVVMPYNASDNSRESTALGTTLSQYERRAGAARLDATLRRWSTASRSSVALISENGVDWGKLYKYRSGENYWKFRPRATDPASIFGEDVEKGETIFSKAQSQPSLTTCKFYSVKAGVQYIGSDSQSAFEKTSIKNTGRTMKRSELIHAVRGTLKEDSLKAGYQVEILGVQLDTTLADDAARLKLDGFEVRDISPSPEEVWFPALAIPGSGKAFAQAWAGDGVNWVDFWKRNFAEPLGRAKAEMLAFFGLQHMTSGAQNMLIAFDRRKPGSASTRVILRDFGDTLLNDHAFAVLARPDTPFCEAWAFEEDADDGITLGKGRIGGFYGDPKMTRTGTTIVFFFPRFQKVDLESDAAGILATWGIALNEAFLQYFRDKLGYTADWQVPDGSNEKTPHYFPSVFRKDYAHRMKGLVPDLQKPDEPKAPDQYELLVSDVLKLPSVLRQRLIFDLAEKCASLDPTEPHIAANLVASHDMLIGAEVQCYLQSEIGRKHLAKLHEDNRRS
jgi:hypothetical protein